MSLNRHVATAVSCLLVVVVFVVDLRQPPGLAAPLVYLPVLLLTVLARSWGLVVGIAAASLVLTLVALPLSPEGGNPYFGLLNRVLVVISIVVVTPLILGQIRTREEMRRLSMRDQLTGLSNRRHLAEVAERQIAQAERYDHPLTLAIIDIDHFKKINDTHGHEVGDHVLRDVAAELASTMREVDLVARIGGEEFAILMPGVRLADGSRAIERLRRAIETRVFRSNGNSIAIRVSAGVAALASENSQLIDLMRSADQRLYRAKQEGRNRVYPSENEADRDEDNGDGASWRRRPA